MDDKLKNILLEYKNLPNKDLEYALQTLSEEHDDTKKLLIKLTHQLDLIEGKYNSILEEYKSRNKKL